MQQVPLTIRMLQYPVDGGGQLIKDVSGRSEAEW